jgi:putative membrane protein
LTQLEGRWVDLGPLSAQLSVVPAHFLPEATMAELVIAQREYENSRIVTVCSEAIEQDLDEILPEEDIVKLRSAIHAPLELTLWLGDYLQKQVQSDRIDTNYFVTMNSHLNALVEGLTSCERILKTPLPPAYCIYLKRLILIYCIGLPFHLVVEIDWLTAIAVGLVSFILLGIEQIGNEIENPFGHDLNDLPIDTICESVTANVEQAIAYSTK